MVFAQSQILAKLQTELIDLKAFQLKGAGKNKEITANEAQDSDKKELVARILQLDEYFTAILDAKLPNLCDLTLRSLFTIFSSVTGIHKSIRAKIPKDTGCFTKKKLEMFAIKIKKRDLIQTIMRTYTISSDQSESIVDLFTYKCDTHDVDLMTKLFIEYNNNLYPLLALTAPEPSYIAGHWLKTGGFPLDERGPLFESQIREGLLKIGTRFSINAYKHSINFEVDDVTEEIDAAFIFGATLYICEIKCSLPALSEHDRFIHYSKMVGACSQCERKAGFVLANLHSFKEKYFKGSTINNVKTLAISNIRLLTGHQISKTITTDKNSFFNYFSFEEPKIIGNDDGNVDDSIPYDILSYYPSPETAHLYFDKYLRTPPQMSYYERRMHLQQHISPALDISDKHILQYTLELRSE